MDLDRLRAFLTVVETGSLLSAGEALKISRSTVRRRIEELEADAGTTLLMRTRHGAVPTPAGLLLAERGKMMMQEVSALLASLREVGEEPSGLLRVMLPVGIPPQAILGILTMVRNHLPNLTFRIRFSSDPLSGLLDDVDLAFYIGTTRPKGPWLTHSLLVVRERLVAHPDYLARNGTPKTLDDLHKHSLLAWDSPDEDPRVWPTLTGGRFEVDPTLIAGDIFFLHQCAADGQGICFVPDAPSEETNPTGENLVPVLPDVVGRERRFRVVVPKALAEIPKIKSVLKLLVNNTTLLPIDFRPDSLPIIR